MAAKRAVTALEDAEAGRALSSAREQQQHSTKAEASGAIERTAGRHFQCRDFGTVTPGSWGWRGAWLG